MILFRLPLDSPGPSPSGTMKLTDLAFLFWPPVNDGFRSKLNGGLPIGGGDEGRMNGLPVNGSLTARCRGEGVSPFRSLNLIASCALNSCGDIGEPAICDGITTGDIGGAIIIVGDIDGSSCSDLCGSGDLVRSGDPDLVVGLLSPAFCSWVPLVLFSLTRRGDVRRGGDVVRERRRRGITG